MASYWIGLDAEEFTHSVRKPCKKVTLRALSALQRGKKQAVEQVRKVDELTALAYERKGFVLFSLEAGNRVIVRAKENNRYLNVALAHHLDQVKTAHAGKSGIGEYHIEHGFIEFFECCTGIRDHHNLVRVVAKETAC